MKSHSLPRIPLVLCLAGWLVLTAGPSAAQTPQLPQRPIYNEWTVYVNPSLAWQVPVPPGLQAQSDPRRGRSCRFVSGDGAFSLKTWGGTLTPRAGGPLEDAWQEALVLPGRSIDFQRRSGSGFVLAGVMRDGMEFYEKVILGNGAVAGMSITYPTSRMARYAPWVDEIEQGFRWHPQAAALTDGGVPPRRGIFSGVRDYFTGEDERSGATRETRPLPPVQDPKPSPSPAPRDPTRTKIDLTPPPPVKPKDRAPVEPLEKPTVQPPAKPAPQPAPIKRDDLPYGTPILGKPGYVYSPYDEKKQQVDVSGIPTGTKVKCPYTGKVFRVP